MHSHWRFFGLQKKFPNSSRLRAVASKHRRYRMWGLAVTFLLFIGTLANMSGASTALAASIAGRPNVTFVGDHKDYGKGPRPHVSSTTCPTTSLCYYGGPVQHNPKVYLIFWGPAWSQDSDHVIPAMVRLFSSLGGGDYNNILSQYSDSKGSIQNTTVLATTTQGTPYYIDTRPLTGPSTGMDMNTVAQEAFYGLEKAGGIPYPNPYNGYDTQVLVFPEEGTVYNASYSDTCGEHAYASLINNATVQLAFSMVRYLSPHDSASPAGCESLSTSTDPAAENMTEVASHEYAETVTDPLANASGWTQGSDTTEIGDVCNWDSTINDYSPINASQVTVQDLWSNQAPLSGGTRCVLANGQEYPSPVSPGKHTVQNAILSDYLSHNANLGILKDPLSEETSVSSGRVSYFVGPCTGAGTGPDSSCAAIYSTGSTGAHAIWGNDYVKYLISLGGPTGRLQWPTTDPVSATGGDYITFSGGCASGVTANCSAIYDSNYGVFGDWGNDQKKYVSLGGPTGKLGWPTTDPVAATGGSYTYFHGSCGAVATTNCSAIYDGTWGTYAIWGNLLQKYMNLKETSGRLGWPSSDPISATGGSYSYFGSGCSSSNTTVDYCSGIYDSSLGTFGDWGNDEAKYQSMGGPTGRLGWPASDPIVVTGGAYTFFGGSCAAGVTTDCSAIYDSSNGTQGSGTFADWGNDEAKYLSLGGPTGKLGWPEDDPIILDGGAYTIFTGKCDPTVMTTLCSAIYDKSGVGTFAIWGSDFQAYLDAGGPTGTLGWPTSDPHGYNGLTYSCFQHGYIQIASNGTATAHTGTTAAC